MAKEDVPDAMPVTHACNSIREHKKFKEATKKRKADVFTDDDYSTNYDYDDYSTNYDYDDDVASHRSGYSSHFHVIENAQPADNAVAAQDEVNHVSSAAAAPAIITPAPITPVNNDHAPPAKKTKTEVGFHVAAGAVIGALATYSFLLSPMAASIAA